MVVGLVFTAGYIIYFKFINPQANAPDNWWLGISPEGIGTLGMLLNFAVSITLSKLFPPPPRKSAKDGGGDSDTAPHLMPI